MNGYGANALTDEEFAQWEQRMDVDETSAFTGLFGPDKIPENIGEFLNYFMSSKVMAGKDLMESAGTVNGPPAVSTETSKAAQPGWTVNLEAVQLNGRWHAVEVGNVYPSRLPPGRPCHRRCARRGCPNIPVLSADL